MKIISSYGVELRKQNIPIRQTLDVYRAAVSYLTEVYAQVWEELERIPGTKKRFNEAEHLIHTTKKNQARFDFDIRFPKMPSYLRRASIQNALGSVSSYKTRLGLWEKTDRLEGKPRLVYENHAMPVFYRDVMYREDEGGKDAAYLKLYDGHDWKWFHVRLSHTDMEYLRKNGQLMGKVTGDIRVLLSGERVALNYLQRMSGIASYTRSVVSLLGESKTKLLDTRKTTPNMRIFEKYAVRAGGGYNHRYNLSDGVLLKDNHIGAAGSVAKAIQMAKEYAPFVRKIEVEVENLDMVKEAVEAGADIIMLDNMSTEEMQEAIRIIDGRAETECSGNVTKENIGRLTALGVDYISSGALTHSAPILDISLKHLHAVL